MNMYFRETGYEIGNERKMVQDHVQWRVVVLAVLNVKITILTEHCQVYYTARVRTKLNSLGT
jgi:hypothetical protein